jgi:hypothetical protein
MGNQAISRFGDWAIEWAIGDCDLAIHLVIGSLARLAARAGRERLAAQPVIAK